MGGSSFEVPNAIDKNTKKYKMTSMHLGLKEFVIATALTVGSPSCTFHDGAPEAKVRATEKRVEKKHDDPVAEIKAEISEIDYQNEIMDGHLRRISRLRRAFIQDEQEVMVERIFTGLLRKIDRACPGVVAKWEPSAQRNGWCVEMIGTLAMDNVRVVKKQRCTEKVFQAWRKKNIGPDSSCIVSHTGAEQLRQAQSMFVQRVAIQCQLD